MSTTTAQLELIPVIPKHFQTLDIEEAKFRRDWGEYVLAFLNESRTYAVKLLILYPGQSQNPHRHFHKSETWVVTEGTLMVDEYDMDSTEPSKTHKVKTNYSCTVEKTKIHRLRNNTKKPVKLVEIQVGEHIMENDIEFVVPDPADDSVFAIDKRNEEHVRANPIPSSLENQDCFLDADIRPWGKWTTVLEHQNFKIKVIEVNVQGELSDQSHEHRSEHWVIVDGTARVMREKGPGELKYHFRTPGTSIFLPCQKRHRLFNPGLIPITLIEVQVGTYLGEDDIKRFEDKYNRS